MKSFLSNFKVVCDGKNPAKPKKNLREKRDNKNNEKE